MSIAPSAPSVRRGKQRRTQEERSAETRSKLIQAAIDVICAQGYANLTTSDIAAAAGVSRGALQHHFGARYDLIAAVNERLTNEMLALGDELSAEKLLLPARVDAVIRHYWSVYTSTTYLAILNISLGIRDDDPMRRRVRRHFLDIYRKSDAPWVRLFEDTGVSRAELIALRRLSLATLRGLALAHFLGIQQRSAQSELDLLKRTLLDRLNRSDPHRASECAA